MIKNFEDTIKRYNMIEEGDTVVAGISGGADSVCMLLNLIEYKKKTDFELKVVHINHLIRKEAAKDAEFVRKLCDEFGIEFILYEEEVEKMAESLGISTEEAGRKIRYERFNEQLTGKGKIAVAHNSNDVAETVLFNIFRGTGPEGLASLEPVNGRIIRPMLEVTRQEIEEYLKLNGRDHVHDATNDTDMYARNKIRNNILPYVEREIVSNATGHIAALSEKMRLVRHYIEARTAEEWDRTAKIENGKVSFDINCLDAEDELIRQELILLALEKLTDGRKDIGEVHVRNILSLLKKEGNKKADLPYGLEAKRVYDELIIGPEEEAGAVFTEYELSDGSVCALPDGKTLRVRFFDRDTEQEIPQKTYTKWFDYDKISNCVKLRSRQTGDYLTVNSLFAHKSLKEYMINCKIPKQERDRIPLIADGDHIMWVVGYRISEYYKVTDDTKHIMEIITE